MSSHATLSAASDDRKARLAKLKSLKRKQPDDDDEDNNRNGVIVPPPTEKQQTLATPDDSSTPLAAQPEPETQEENDDVARRHLSLRNYDPETRGPKLGFEAPPTLGLAAPTLEEKAAELEAETRRRAEEEAGDERGVDLFKLQPKRPNWDLKRELARKLEVLNVRTENAIARLVRERLAAKKEAAAAVNGDAHTAAGDKDGGDAAAALEGAELVEGIRLREREEEDEERREREEEEEGMA